MALSDHKLPNSPLQRWTFEMAMYLGFDPGGAGAFGWCVLEGDKLPLAVVTSGIGRHAHQAISNALEVTGDRAVAAAGIDAPLFWRSDGDRIVDQQLRKQIVRLGAHAATVNSINSMRGACLVQGMMTAMLLRQKLGHRVQLTEAHPKAGLWLLGIATRSHTPDQVKCAELSAYMQGDVEQYSDHERDAAFGALSAFAMHQELDGWHNLFPEEDEPVLTLSQPLGYWMPR